MGSSRYMLLFSALFGLWFWSSCEAYQFYVGGRDGWVLTPSESYSAWPHRQRFQVNDTLLFKYAKGSDSVLVVNRDDFDKCNKTNPITKLDGGGDVFKFDRSGPFYFISGQDDHCQKGQKLVTVVLAIRSPPASSPPRSSPPSPSPAPKSPSPANPPKSPSPAPITEPPSSETPSPAYTPAMPPSSASPSPAYTPAMPPSSSSPSPAYTPAMPPSGSTPEPFSPEANSPESSPSSDESSPPAPAKASSEAVTPRVLMLLITGLFGAAIIV